jgi:glycosyltransferase involved in cell wall biosynthesis
MVQESGKNGLIFSWDKEGDFEEKLQQLLNMSDEELKTMGDNAKARITELTNLEDNYQKRKTFYENVIKNHKHKTEFPFITSMPYKKAEKEYEGKKDLLSVVIPYYNLGETLPETIDSIRATEYKNYEIIIVNDGSTDEASVKMLDNYRDDKDVTVVDIPNGGLANARNVGASHANGEYVAFLDADDKIDPTFYTKAINILKTYSNVSYVYSWVKYFESSEGVWPTFNTHIPYLLCANMLAAFVVIRKNDFLNFGLNRTKMIYGMEDYDSWISLAQAGRMGVSIPETLNLYRIRKDSMSRGFNENNRTFLYEKMIEGHEEIYAKYAKEAFMLLQTNGQSFYWSSPGADIPIKSLDGESLTPAMMQRLRTTNKVLNTLPGKAVLKVYRALKKIKPHKK